MTSYCGDTSFWYSAQKLAQNSALLSRCGKSFLVAYIDLSDGKIFTTMEWLMVFVKVPL